MHVDIGRCRDSNELRPILDPDDVCPALDDLVSQRSIAAADVEDSLANLGIEQVEPCRAQLGDEPTDARIVRGVPPTGRGDGRAQSVFTQSR